MRVLDPERTVLEQLTLSVGLQLFKSVPFTAIFFIYKPGKGEETKKIKKNKVTDGMKEGIIKTKLINFIVTSLKMVAIFSLTIKQDTHYKSRDGHLGIMSHLYGFCFFTWSCV